MTYVKSCLRLLTLPWDDAWVFILRYIKAQYIDEKNFDYWFLAFPDLKPITGFPVTV